MGYSNTHEHHSPATITEVYIKYYNIRDEPSITPVRLITLVCVCLGIGSTFASQDYTCEH